MNRALLEQPFDEQLIRSRKGAFGQTLNYVEAVHYIRRLNEVFESNWSWKVIGHEQHGNEFVVHGVLEAGGEVKHAFGGSQITLHSTTGEAISLADDIKAAATDALKKACSLLGIGLDLYATDSSPPSSKRPHLKAVNGRDSDGASEVSRNRLTAKQLKAIYAIAHGQGCSDAELKRICVSVYSVAPEFLSKQDASSFIEYLNTDG